MSQGDYLKHKKTAHILKENKLKPVLTSQDYLSFKQFQIVNTIENNETNYGELVPDGKKKIFGMELAVTNCPSFILCQNTNTRNNRVPLSTIYSDPTPLIYSDTYFPDRFANCSICNKLKEKDLQCCSKSRLRMQMKFS